MNKIMIRFYAELNDLLPPARRQQAFFSFLLRAAFSKGFD